jgi:hypothetical protein
MYTVERAFQRHGKNRGGWREVHRYDDGEGPFVAAEVDMAHEDAEEADEQEVPHQSFPNPTQMDRKLVYQKRGLAVELEPLEEAVADVI